MTTESNKWRLYGPAALCRMDEELVLVVAGNSNCRGLFFSACLAVLLCSAAYGAVFGAWRSVEQTLYSALKMPFLIFAVVTGSGLIIVMLAQVLGARLSARQTAVSILLSMAVASVLMAALSPVMLYVVFQCPPADSSNAMSVYGMLLVFHTAVVGVCGIIGNVRLFQLLVRLTNSRSLSWRVLGSWIVVTGFLGCQLSWLFSPFLARPDMPVPFFNPNAFSGNFFEYLWTAMNRW